MTGTTHTPATGGFHEIFPYLPDSVITVFQHPFLICLVLFAGFTAYVKFKEAVEEGKIEISEKTARTMFLGFLIVAFIIVKL